MMHGDRAGASVSRVVLIAGAALFCMAGLYRLGDLFEFHLRDEIFKYLLAFETAGILAGRETSAVFCTLPVDLRMPFVMYAEHVGSPWLFPAALSISLFGPLLGAFAAFKLVMIAAALAGVVAVFYVVSHGFGRLTGALAAFFLATNHVYVHAARIGFYREEILQVSGLWAGLALCLLAVRRRKGLWLCAGFFVFGLTLWAKVMFVIYVLCFAFGLLAVGKTRAQSLLTALFPDLRSALCAAGSFIAGSAPMLLFNFRCGFSIFRRMALRIAEGVDSTNAGETWNNRHVLSNLAFRVRNVFEYVSGTLFNADFFNVFGLTLFACAFFWGLYQVFCGAEGRRREWLKFMFAAYALLVVAVCFLPFGVSAGHILLVVPFFEILLAVCAVSVINAAGKTPVLRACALACFMAVWCGGQLANGVKFNDKYFVRGDFAGLYASESDRVVARLLELGISDIVISQPLVSIVRCRAHGGMNIGTYIDLEECTAAAAAFLDRTGSACIYMLVPSVECESSAGAGSPVVSGANCELVETFAFRKRRDCSFDLYRVWR